MTFLFPALDPAVGLHVSPSWAPPGWAQAVGNILPLTHFLVLVRGIPAQGNGIDMLWPQVWPILLFMAAVRAGAQDLPAHAGLMQAAASCNQNRS